MYKNTCDQWVATDCYMSGNGWEKNKVREMSGNSILSQGKIDILKEIQGN